MAGICKRRPPARLSPIPNAASYPSVAQQSKRVAFSVRIQDENIWRMDLTGKQTAMPIIDSPQTDSTPALSPDGQLLAFRSSRTGTSEIWVSDLESGSLKRLTHFGEGEAGSPDWSPDGRYIAYTAALKSAPHIWIISRDGGTKPGAL